MSNPKISACIITYNQEKYLKECLEGAVNQIVSFDYEIVIGDDCSTDGTSEICLMYQEKYPQLIKYHRRSTNIGMVGNWLQTIQDCKGEYIALCEGDDYWTDPSKLQKQLRFIERDQNDCFSIVATYASVFSEKQKRNTSKLPSKDINQVTFVEYLLEDPVVYPVCTFLFNANKLKKNFRKFSTSVQNGFFVDGVLLLFLLSEGQKLYIMDETTASYRVDTGTSVTSNKNNLFFIQSWINTIERGKVFFYQNEQEVIRKHISIQYQRLASEFFKTKNFPRAIQSMFFGMRSINIFNLKDIKDYYWRVFKS